MKKTSTLLFVALSVIFTISYCQFLFQPSSQIIGVDTTDSYQFFSVISTANSIMQSGHLPIGTFWLFNLYGGTVGSYLHGSVFPEVQHTIFLLINAIANDFVVSLKILAVITIAISQVLSYKFAKSLFKNTAIAWLFSIAYTFSTFTFNSITHGHLGFTIGAALMPGVLLAAELMFNSPTRKNMVFLTVGLIVLFNADLQITIFTSYYLLLRILFQVFVNHKKPSPILKRLAETACLFVLAVGPSITSFIMLHDVSSLLVPSIPTEYVNSGSQYFLRGIAVNATSGFSSYYIGFSLLLIAFLPLFFGRGQSNPNQRNYIFYFITFIFFFLMAIGTPISSLATLFFIRVPSRAQSLIFFSLYICAGFGLLRMGEVFRTKRKFKTIAKNKVLPIILVACLTTTVFIDVTWGMEPMTSTVPHLSGGDNFIKNQEGNYRILKYPLIWAYTNYESSLLGHEIVGSSVINLRSYPKSSDLYSQQVDNFNSIGSSATMDKENFTLYSTLLGIKYAVIEKNSTQSAEYIQYFNNASSYFSVVYQDSESVVFENLYFEGMVFAVRYDGPSLAVDNITLSDFLNLTENQQVNYTEGFNQIKVQTNASSSEFIVLSQSYNPYWTLSGAKTTTFTRFLNLSAFQVESGPQTVSASFSASYQTEVLYVCFIIPLSLLILAVYAETKQNLKAKKIILAGLLFCGITLIISLVLIATMIPNTFAIFSKVILGLGCFSIAVAIFGLSQKKVFSLSTALWQNFRGIFLKLCKRVKHVNTGGMTHTPALSRKKAASLSRVFNRLIKILLTITILIIILANVGRVTDTINWLNDAFVYTLSAVLLMYIFEVSYLDPLNDKVSDSTGNEFFEEKKNEEKGIRQLHLGIFGGLIATILSGILVRELAIYTGEFSYWTLIVCGLFSGIGIGLLTSGSSKKKGLLAVIFGIVAMIFAFMMLYTTPVTVGYRFDSFGNPSIPIYKWQQYSFVNFLIVELSGLNNLFYAFMGLIIAYLTGVYLSLRTKQ